MRRAALFAVAALVILPTATKAQTQTPDNTVLVCASAVSGLRCLSDLLVTSDDRPHHSLRKYDSLTNNSIAFR